MSFEGYFQILCENGHYFCPDVYSVANFAFKSYDEWECPICQAKMAWYNIVDLTNGSEDEDGNPIDGYVELEIKEQSKCEHCGSVIGETIYKIPENGGHKV